MNAPMLPASLSYAELRKVNVSEFVEKKNNLSYLSWAWAVDQLLQRDPSASWEYRWHDNRPFVSIGETAMVFCTVKAFGTERTAFLPVMDYKNRPIPNPNSFEVNTAMQRALAKAISLHGLGLYIYAGEDLPPGEEPPTEPPKAMSKITGKATLEDEYNKLDEKEREWLHSTANAITDWIAAGNVKAATEELDHAIPYIPRKDSKDGQYKSAIQHILPTNVMKAIKEYRQQLKEAA